MKPSTKAVKLADRSSSFGRAHKPHPACESRAQHAAAVHREGRNEVEERQKEVQRGKPIYHCHLHVVDTDRGACAQVCMGKNNQRAGDDHVHSRPGDRDEEFLPWIFRNTLKLRDASNRQQRHVGCWYAEGPGGEDVPEFVQQHAQEQKYHEEQRFPRRSCAVRRVAGSEDPREKQHEGDVQAHDRTRYLSDAQ
jgi:hypothetical protein